MNRQKARLVRTPIHKIPLGETIKKSDGTYALRVKKPKSNEYEEVPMDILMSIMVKEAERNAQ